MRTLSHQGGSDNRGHVGGPDTWSPDGKWIYFDDSGAVYRVNVVGDSTQRLTGDDIGAYAPASSPDGTHIAFIVDHNQQYWDLYAANSDGTDVHKLLDHAEHDGWSADSRYILAQWNPTDPPGLAAWPSSGPTAVSFGWSFHSMPSVHKHSPARGASMGSVGARLGRDRVPKQSRHETRPPGLPAASCLAPGRIRAGRDLGYCPNVARKLEPGVPRPVTLSQPAWVDWVGDPE